MRAHELVESASVFDDLIARYNGKSDGEVDYLVYRNTVGNLMVSWSITFRRNTRVGAYEQYRVAVNRANNCLKQIADANQGLVITDQPCTAAKCKAGDEFAESNGDNAYSEYEQAIGGSLVLRNTTPEKRKRDGRKFHSDIYDALSKKLNGKKFKNAVFTVTQPDGNSKFRVSWKFEFSGMRYNSALAQNGEMWSKVNDVMDKIMIKYNDHIVDVNRKTASEYRELSRYIYDHEVKNTHSMDGSITFLEVLPTDTYTINKNNARKAVK